MIAHFDTGDIFILHNTINFYKVYICINISDTFIIYFDREYMDKIWGRFILGSEFSRDLPLYREIGNILLIQQIKYSSAKVNVVWLCMCVW